MVMKGAIMDKDTPINTIPSSPTPPAKDLNNVPDPTKLLESLHIEKPPMPSQPTPDTSSHKPQVLTAGQSEPEEFKPEGVQIDSKITDFEGRFGFLVEKGRYILTVNKTGYRFPSKIMQGQEVDFDRRNLYFGETLTIDDPNLVDVAIPIDPVSFNFNQASKPKQYHPPLFPFKEHLYTILTFLGLLFTLFVYLFDPTPFNLVFLVVYIILVIIFRFTHAKKWGTVYHSLSKKVLPLVTVRALKVGGALAGLTQTDHIGRYYLLLEEGEHTLQVEENIGNGEMKVLGTKSVLVEKNKPLVAVDIAV